MNYFRSSNTKGSSAIPNSVLGWQAKDYFWNEPSQYFLWSKLIFLFFVHKLIDVMLGTNILFLTWGFLWCQREILQSRNVQLFSEQRTRYYDFKYHVSFFSLVIIILSYRLWVKRLIYVALLLTVYPVHLLFQRKRVLAHDKCP